ncbi:DsbE family thiol:disulfide interchange protein [Neoehrlichia mikurensis]|uniref:DsbE family thiol:disulfide interchange protein n=1 Tax=Neoehrlichia mikurensis TaxID=89586 RepID=A0A9Q9BSS0_9RICK|nr:DsbE family thiol:disulfide interchange protein [Neoehrlichia mikurensis]QXK91714.1 DsbE family thiol:disulfide interchange protein [Neoehrlichia mikurensis]QXK92926.1 DsbE family thiol:disulfide interchange protein [Neoehrlichia mikurensis]QXK93404.1 DsbE family thiol:disulfide interchange protein [Neoehrlichia mikurensis]UTO55645.1 DsbE family thiol:disulfide interchange protein [Neoehrlichia mikurensis]UTO56565.1 DsbE family thiol:disulfide interchange protein [Neoehrlichia mikurensis]
MKAICIILLIIFLLLVTTFLYAIYNKNLNNPSYDLTLPYLLQEDKQFTTSNLKGSPYIIHIFASWCITCKEEHKVWLEIAQKNIVDIYGISYLDIKNNVIAWLQENGNPYKIVAADYSGKTGSAFGVTGVPETFVFDKYGKVILHISGNITLEIWENQILNLLKK